MPDDLSSLGNENQLPEEYLPFFQQLQSKNADSDAQAITDGKRWSERIADLEKTR